MRVIVKSPLPGDEVRVAVSTTTGTVAHTPRRLCWLLVAGLHGLSIAYHGLMAVVYIHSGPLRAPFSHVTYVEGVVIDRKYFRTIGVGAATIATIHVLFLARMIHASIVASRLAFQRAVSRKSSSVSSRVGSMTAAITSARRLTAKMKSSILSRGRIPRHLLPLVRCMNVVRFHLTHRQGLLGIDGLHFENVFLLRELFQIGFQSYQAWRMAERVPIAWLNHFNVVLVCLNCWSMPLLEWRQKRQHQRVGPNSAMLSRSVHRRLAAILVDCCLDSLAVSLMSLVIFLPYLGMLVENLDMFRTEFLLNDLWITRTMNEFQIVFVVSWWDAISRILFALFTIISLQAVHNLSHDHFDAVSTHGPTRRPSKLTSQRTNHGPHVQTYRIRGLIRVAMVLWGCAIASLHIHAAWFESPQHCALPLRPWGLRKPACAAVVLNCYRAGITGSRQSLEAIFEAMASHFVSLIILQHCAALEMPRTLQTHNQLISLRIHNATLIHWKEDARLTSTTNPVVRALSFTRLQWPDGGQLPRGLFGEHSPSTIVQMYIQLSNLHSLPPDLHERLPQLNMFMCNLCEFRTFPTTLLSLDPVLLSLERNKLTTVPLTRLIAPGRKALTISVPFNPLNDSIFDTEGLTDPAISYRLRYLPLMNTSVTSVPSWFATNPVVSQRHLFVRLGGSPYCAGKTARGINCLPAMKTDDARNSIAMEDLVNPL